MQHTGPLKQPQLPPLCPHLPRPERAYAPGAPREGRFEAEAWLSPMLPGNWNAEDWRELTPYLYGIDLYHEGFFWEAHEAWELLWTQAPRGSREKALLRALIRLTAAALKWRTSNTAGARKHIARLAPLIDEAGAGNRYSLLGLDLPRLRTELHGMLAAVEDGPFAAEALPVLRTPLHSELAQGVSGPISTEER